MSNPVEKMTIKNLADELGVSKNTVRNQLVNSGFDLAQYKENGIIMLDINGVFKSNQVLTKPCNSRVYEQIKRMVE